MRLKNTLLMAFLVIPILLGSDKNDATIEVLMEDRDGNWVKIFDDRDIAAYKSCLHKITLKKESAERVWALEAVPEKRFKIIVNDETVVSGVLWDGHRSDLPGVPHLVVANDRLWRGRGTTIIIWRSSLEDKINHPKLLEALKELTVVTCEESLGG